MAAKEMIHFLLLLAQAPSWPVTIIVPPGTQSRRITITLEDMPVVAIKPPKPACEYRDRGENPVVVSIPPAIPAGGRYCDPAFGSEVLRVSGDGETIQTIGSLGFNRDGSRIAVVTSGGGVRVYDIATGKDSLQVGVSHDTPYSWASWWSPYPDVIMSVRGRTVRAYNVANKDEWLVSDLSSVIPEGYELGRASGDGLRFVAAVWPVNGAPLQFARIGYVAVEILGLHEQPLAWTLLAKHINGVDSPRITEYQRVQGITLTSPYEPGLDQRGGYKCTIAEGGWQMTCATWDASGNSGKYNTVAVLDLRSKKWTFAQTTGHGMAGRDGLVAINTSGYGSCVTAVKFWRWSALTPSPSVRENQGECLSQSIGWGNFDKHYVATGNGRHVAAMSCASDGCGGPWAGELREVGKRIAKLWASKDGYQEVQPVVSQDGKLVAFTNNINGKAVYIARMPE